MNIDPVLLEQAKAHAMREYPRECCGLFIDDEYVPMENISTKPHTDFEMNPAEWSKYYLTQRVFAVIHSHSSGIPHPSKSDMQSQMDCQLPFGIIVMENKTVVRDVFFFGDQARDWTRHYEGRTFRHGVDDCYELVREYYRREAGIMLPYFPRNANWWTTGEEVLIDNFKGMGFKEIEFRQLKKGDGLLLKVLQEKANHCGVYVGGGEVLHHLAGSDRRVRYSRKENVHAWKDNIVMCLRHKDGFPVK